VSEALDTLVGWGRARRPARVLDVGTGDGQTALAFAAVARTLTTYDALPSLTAARDRLAARDASNIRYVAGDAATLPFGDDTFDLVTCRLAAHRFAEPAATLREMRRVLRPAGTLLLQDLLGHDDAEANAFMRGLAARRDPGYVRAYRTSEWNAFLRAAGLTVMEQTAVMAVRAWRDWAGGLTPETKLDAERMMRAAPERVRSALDIRLDAVAIEAFTDRMLLVRAERD